MNLPLEFRCPSCQQRLTAKAEKAGRRVKCPRCGGSLVVPEEQPPLPAPTPLLEGPPASSGEWQAVQASELPVIVVGEESPRAPRAAVPEAFDPSWVSFPRRLIYAHAAVLALAFAGAFGLGYWVGRDQRPNGAVESPPDGPIALDGRVTYTATAGEPVGDDGAVIVALPRARRPGRTEKPSLAGLGPHDPPPAENDPVVEAIGALGGAYLRADADGRFRVVLPQAGEYYLLHISRHVVRPAADEVRREHLADMGEYFSGGLELIGRQQYSWALRQLDAQSDVSHGFAQP